jgi:5-methylcytosine-specific restriction enzyme subunit McrC
MNEPQRIWLTEYRPVDLPPETMPKAVGELLWRGFRRQVEVEFPTPITGEQWRLTSQGWVGHIPLTPDFHFILQPKVALRNLFRMLEVAYRLDWLTPAGLVDCQSLAEFYERLAHLLARRVLERGRKGFYRSYLAQTEPLPYLRGRLDLAEAARSPGQVKFLCHYEEQTADVEENRILAWTLWRVARSGLCTERTAPAVRRAYRALQSLTTLQPYPAEACLDRLYNRLNDDYQPLHALCRFFLEQSGPGADLGDRAMLPFLVEMARLFELFVAEWLKAHLPPGLQLKAQERVHLGEAGGLHFEIDLVLYDPAGRPRCVLDTKYKMTGKPASDDISQVVAYAEAKGCREAILVYPTTLAQPLAIKVGNIQVRSLTFALDGDLEAAGRSFLASIELGGT